MILWGWNLPKLLSLKPSIICSIKESINKEEPGWEEVFFSTDHLGLEKPPLLKLVPIKPKSLSLPAMEHNFAKSTLEWDQKKWENFLLKPGPKRLALYLLMSLMLSEVVPPKVHSWCKALTVKKTQQSIKYYPKWMDFQQVIKFLWSLQQIDWKWSINL